MKMPSKIKCACFEYTLSEHGRAEMGDNMGDLNRETKRIRVSSELVGQVKKETLLHELMHVALDEYGVDDEVEERLIRLLSPRMLEIFQRNPKLVEVIFGKEKN